MSYMETYKFSKSHEWVDFSDDTTAKIGITDFAQHELGDLVFVNLPEVGSSVTAGEVCADVESVKAVSDIYSPVTGTVKAVNEYLLDHPEKINEDAAGSWLFEVENITETDDLMDGNAYQVFLQTEKK